MILSFVTTILTATTIVRERERGTNRTVDRHTIRSWELILGKILPYVFLAFIETFEIIIIGPLLVRRACARQSYTHYDHIGLVPNVKPRHWPIGIHDCQYPAGSHAHGHDV